MAPRTFALQFRPPELSGDASRSAALHTLHRSAAGCGGRRFRRRPYAQQAGRPRRSHQFQLPERRAAFLAAVGRGMLGGWGIDDHAGLLWEGEAMTAALSFRQGARCYRIRVRDGEVTETPLAAKRMRSRLEPGRYDEIAELRRTLRARPGVRRLG